MQISKFKLQFFEHLEPKSMPEHFKTSGLIFIGTEVRGCAGQSVLEVKR